MYLGIDTHKHYSQAAVVVAHDGNLQDEIRLENKDLAALGQEYAGGEAAIEASGTYRPIYAVEANAPGLDPGVEADNP